MERIAAAAAATPEVRAQGVPIYDFVQAATLDIIHDCACGVGLGTQTGTKVVHLACAVCCVLCACVCVVCV